MLLSQFFLSCCCTTQWIECRPTTALLPTLQLTDIQYNIFIFFFHFVFLFFSFFPFYLREWHGTGGIKKLKKEEEEEEEAVGVSLSLSEWTRSAGCRQQLCCASSNSTTFRLTDFDYSEAVPRLDINYCTMRVPAASSNAQTNTK